MCDCVFMIHRGFSKTIILVGVAAVALYVAVAYCGVTPQRMMDTVRSARHTVADDVSTVAVDKVVKEGRQVVGEKLKTTGEKMLREESSAGRFVPYDASLVATAPYTIIFFTGPNCPACAAARMSFESSASSIPADTIILEAQYDDDTLRNRYHVGEPATFIAVDATGTEVKRWTNTRTVEETVAALPR